MAARTKSVASAACACGRVVLEPDGGSAYVVFRKDRVAWSKGAELLKQHKLDARSPTHRVVATCCHSAMLLGFDDSKHWVSVFRTRFGGDLPPIEMHVMTRHRPAGNQAPSAVPGYAGFPARFLAKLVAARIAMLFYR